MPIGPLYAVTLVSHTVRLLDKERAACIECSFSVFRIVHGTFRLMLLVIIVTAAAARPMYHSGAWFVITSTVTVNLRRKVLTFVEAFMG